MTVETDDGRRISATLKHGHPSCTSGSQNESLESNLDSSTATTRDATGGNERSSDTTILSPTRDIATTIAIMGNEKIVSTAPSTLQTTNFEACASREWAMNYRNKYVVVTCSNIDIEMNSTNQNGNGQKTNGSSASGSDKTTSLPPKKRVTVKTEEAKSECSWNAMSALVDAATVAQREHEESPPCVQGVGESASAKATTTMAIGVNIPTTTFKKKPTKRKPRKVIPEIKEYVEFTQKDVLFGRGGRSNHHQGNKIYRDIVTNNQNHYRGCDKNEKTKVAQGIVDHIQNVVGGRFLELDRDIKRWFLVPNVVARRKVGQALRENNTEEARAAKRAKYQGRLNNKKKNLATAKNMASGNGIESMNTDNNSNSVVPVLPISSSNGNSAFPISTTMVPTNSFPIDDAESSNRVA
eukprot:CAMPEP_0197189706 /NCGR_PEP_ID=MMETSP1423-20130617/20263_1 /TAXON_ID=476441 /ORGANISM="Pseudo-nitzschia heimii, Strain UNC1101" /LENGTH=410 /DNA_ID=CAMNT_0042641903 /DNA_START=297 /DNA_END=1525 /DNA_ORIENTATION=-